MSALYAQHLAREGAVVIMVLLLELVRVVFVAALGALWVCVAGAGRVATTAGGGARRLLLELPDLHRPLYGAGIAFYLAQFIAGSLRRQHDFLEPFS